MIVLLLACTASSHDTAPISALQPAVADAGADVMAITNAPVTLDGQASEGVSFVWDLGDGQQASGALITHTYTEPGTYAAVLTVTGEDGGWRSDTAVVTVTAPLAAEPPTWARTIIGVDDSLWVVVPEANQITVLSIHDGALRMEIPVCDRPRTLSHDPQTQEVAVACEDGDAIWGLGHDGGVQWQLDVPIGSRPYGVVGRDGHWHATLQGTGQIITVTDGAVIRTLSVAQDVRGIALAGEDEILATRFRSIGDHGAWYHIDHGVVTAHRLEIDTYGDSDTTTGGVPNLLEEIAPSPDGLRWYVPMLHANVLRGDWRSAQPLDFQTTVRGVLTHIDAQTMTERVLDRKQFDERGRASAVAFSPSGDRMAVLHPGTGAITVLSTSTQQIIGSILDIGTFPTGLIFSDDGAELYVYAWLDRAVVAYPMTDLSTQPEPLWRGDVVTAEPLSEMALLGKRVFHDARDTRLTRSGYVSCAHCHPDGRDDGLTWDFTDRGEGLRNTSSLEGRAGMAMGPLHWTGNFDEVQDFEHDMREVFAGTGFLSEEDWAQTGDPLGVPKAGRSEELDAMAVWLTGLVATPASPHPASPDGEAAFLAAGCDTCHPAPLYTDSPQNRRHDVGTLAEGSGGRLGETIDGLDTPTLLGSWATAPYLHNGTAQTIESAISAHTSVSEADAALIADFVRSL